MRWVFIPSETTVRPTIAARVRFGCMRSFFNQAFWQQVVSSVVAGLVLAALALMLATALGYLKPAAFLLVLIVGGFFGGFYVMTLSGPIQSPRKGGVVLLAGVVIMVVSCIALAAFENHWPRDALLVHHTNKR